MAGYLALLNWPNRLTLLRIFLVGPFVLFLLNMQNPSWPWARRAAILTYFAMAVSDLLDGMLARRGNQETLVGKFLDPLGDKLVITCAVILLAVGSTSVPGFRLPSWVVVAAIGKDLFVVLGFLVLFLSTGKIFIQPGKIGKACTASQMTLVLMVLAGPDLVVVQKPALLAWTCYYLGWYGPKILWVVCTALALATAWDYLRSGLRFAAASSANSSTRAGDSTIGKNSHGTVQSDRSDH